jgi:hypothetical protein
MRFRIYRRDRGSPPLVEPLFIDAADEVEARGKAVDLGMAVEQVEPAPPEGVETRPADRGWPSQAAPSFPAELGGPLARTALPRARRRWALVWFALVPAAVAAGFGIGFLFPHVSRTGPESPPAVPAGLHIEEVKSAKELFDLAGQKAVVFKYSGGEVEFWVEIESQGNKEEIGPVRIEPPEAFADHRQPGSGEAVEGYLLWLRGDPDERGQENWKVAIRRDLVSRQTSAVQISSPLAQAKASQAQESRKSATSSLGRTVQVWKSKCPAGLRGGTSAGEISSIPSPLPTDRVVCLKEIKEKRWQFPQDLEAAGASALGLLGSGRAGPLLAISAFAAGRTEENIDPHTIRIMCQGSAPRAAAGN